MQELEVLVREVNAAKTEPERLGLTNRGEWPLYTVKREHAKDQDEALCAKAARMLLTELQKARALPQGWSTNAGGRKKVSLMLQVASWLKALEALDLCPTDAEDPPFLGAAVEELARAIE